MCLEIMRNQEGRETLAKIPANLGLKRGKTFFAKEKTKDITGHRRTVPMNRTVGKKIAIGAGKPEKNITDPRGEGNVEE
jgi:hypothetical protein